MGKYIPSANFLPSPRSPLRPRKLAEPSQHSRLFEIAQRADIFLTPNQQPFATVPTSGNTVPLYSAIFRSWLTLAFEENGYRPSAAQYGAVLRALDEENHNSPRINPVHIRTALNGPATYRFDLAGTENEAIEINGKEWKTVYNLGCRFRRPQSSKPFPKPDDNPVQLYKFLERLFSLKESDAHALSVWLVAAMLPDLTPPILVITGKAADTAAGKLRNLIDPMINPTLPMHITKQQFGKQALINNVLAFCLDYDLSPKRTAIVNQLSTGMDVVLKDVSKSREETTTKIHRPVILSAAKEIKISATQVVIEINEASLETYADQLFASLLLAVVRGIHEMTRQPKPEPLTYQVMLPNPPPPPAQE